MINSDKDDYFKSLYIEAIGEELDCIPENYEFSDYSGLIFHNKLILDVHSKEPQISDDSSINLMNCNDENIGYIVFTNKFTLFDNYESCTADEILYIWNKYRSEGVYVNVFTCDFVVIFKNYFPEYYSKHYNTSSLWGGYKHKPQDSIEYKATQILRIPDSEIFFPTNINVYNSDMSVYSSNIYENFLKKYHQLELIFNLIFIQKLKSINLENLKDIHSIYKNMNKSEFESIFYIISNYVRSKDKYLKIFITAYFNYQDIYNEIFYEYGKESNPLSDDKLKDKFHLFLTKAVQSNPLNYEEYFNISKDSTVNFKKKDDEFSNFIFKFLTYTIYRIRCSIAHNKLGEFMFNNEKQHLDFMVDVSLPLIRETVVDVFSNQSFKEVFE